MRHHTNARRRRTDSTRIRLMLILMLSTCLAMPLLGHGAQAQSFQWDECPTSVQPAGRYDHGMAYDSSRDRVVVFGGCGNWYSPHYDDTWEWDGSTWTQRFPADHPSARNGNQMEYDAARGVVLLFGGSAAGAQPMNDTWVWDGTNWTELVPAHVPPARYGHGMTYDHDREVVVLFGGSNEDGTRNDTWEWNGIDWIERFPETPPPKRRCLGGSMLAYDPGRDVSVLFGGMSENYPVMLNDTWEWDGTDWVEMFLPELPPARDGQALVVAPYGHDVVLFGGAYGMFNDLWVWDGAVWTHHLPPGPPPNRHRQGMVHDAARSRNILFGGWDFASAFEDTWELAAPCALALLPQRVATYFPCGGSYSLELWVLNAVDLGAFEVCTGFDLTRAEFTGAVVDSTFLGSTGRDIYPLDPVWCSPFCHIAGMRYGAYSMGENPGATGDGPLARVSFSRLGDGAVQDSLCLEDWQLVTTQIPPELIDVDLASGARIDHRSFCYGDFDDDDYISVIDIMQVAARWGCCLGDACYEDTFDVNLLEPGNYCISAADGCIDIVGVQQVAARWGEPCPGAIMSHLAPVDCRPTASVAPQQLEVCCETGDTASLGVVIEEVRDLGAFDMTLTFDPNVIRVQEVTLGDLLESTGRSVHPLDVRLDHADGQMSFAAWTTGPSEGPGGGGLLVSMVVSVTACNQGTPIEISSLTCTDTHGWPMTLAGITNGWVETLCPASTAEPAPCRPAGCVLHAIEPNPLSGSTLISFEVPGLEQQSVPLEIVVYDVSGRSVRCLAKGEYPPGSHSVVWDGRDSQGSVVETGVYFCTLRVQGETRISRLLRVR